MIDEKLANAFMACYKFRNRNKAAESLSITPQAVRLRLKELEERYKLNLFERDSNRGYYPTAFADKLYSTLVIANDMIEAVVNDDITFNHMESRVTFRIAMSEWAEHLIFPVLRQKLANRQANVKVDVITLHNDLINRVQDIEWVNKSLNEGTIDLVLHYSTPSSQPDMIKGCIGDEKLDDRIYSKILTYEDMVGIVNADHPQIKNRISYEQYIKMEHVVIDERMINAYLRPGDTRKINCKVSSLSIIPSIIEQDIHLLSSPPRRLAKKQSHHYKIKLAELPDEIPIPTVQIAMSWIDDSNEIEIHKWMRELIYNVCQSL